MPDNTIDAGGYRTHYHEAGSGPTVVLVHGSGPGVTAWANWRLVLPLLAERFHVLAPDMLGFGESERPAGARYGRTAWVSHLGAFLAAVGVERCSVVGNSMGGALALGLALDQPALVERLVLMGSVGLPFPLTPGLDAVWGYEPSPGAMKSLIADFFAYDRALATDDLAQLRYEASIQPGYQESYAAMFPAPRQRWIDDLAFSPEALRTIAAPTLLVHGREDRVIPLEVSYRLNELLPNAQLHVFGHCGHWTMIERNAAFNALVGAFLAGDLP